LTLALEVRRQSYPAGVVTFLFTDIEDSNRLWDRHGQAMRTVLARHHTLIERLVVEYGGAVVRPRG
jgi:class 3 adenylate cyclase